MENLEIYNKVRKVPTEAQKAIGAGRLKGMTDINPMWRIKVLTEQFGICGFGWYIDNVQKWLENGANGEVVANVSIDLIVKVGEEWSKPIHGVGGSKITTKESAGLYTDDECFKKAYTDAISVACKALGIGADIYWDKDKTKYDTATATKSERQVKPKEEKAENVEKPKPPTQGQLAILDEYGVDIQQVAVYYKTEVENLTFEQLQNLINKLNKKYGGGQ